MHSQPIKNVRLITNVLPIFYLKNTFSVICNTGLFVRVRFLKGFSETSHLVLCHYLCLLKKLRSILPKQLLYDLYITLLNTKAQPFSSYQHTKLFPQRLSQSYPLTIVNCLRHTGKTSTFRETFHLPCVLNSVTLINNYSQILTESIITNPLSNSTNGVAVAETNDSLVQLLLS